MGFIFQVFLSFLICVVFLTKKTTSLRKGSWDVICERLLCGRATDQLWFLSGNNSYATALKATVSHSQHKVVCESTLETVKATEMQGCVLLETDLAMGSNTSLDEDHVNLCMATIANFRRHKEEWIQYREKDWSPTFQHLLNLDCRRIK